MILADHTIEHLVETDHLIIKPFLKECLQPASLDVHLYNEFRVFRNHSLAFIDTAMKNETLTELICCGPGEPFMLHPGEFALGSTIEYVEMPNDLVSRLEGKSSLGRLGLLIHSTAGFVDPGFKGQITLELSNVANLPIALHPGMEIGQLSFLWLNAAARNPYGSEGLNSKYQNQRGPTASLYHLNFDE